MEYFNEYASVLYDFADMVSNQTNVVCSYQYFKDKILLANSTSASVKEDFEDKVGRYINFTDLQNKFSTDNNNNSIDYSIDNSFLLYKYIQDLIKKNTGSYDTSFIFIIIIFKKYNRPVIGHMCILHDPDGSKDFLKRINKFKEINDDIDIVLIG